jgi:hypothetical protein
MAEQYYLIEFGDRWLTHDESETGSPYITIVEGLAQLSQAQQSKVFVALDGTVTEQVTDNGGIPLSIEFETLDEGTYADIIAIIDAAKAGDDDIPVSFDGWAGEIDTNVRVTGVEFTGNAIEAGQKKVKFNLITSGA